jgi:UDP-N-acetylglucosamine--N-acetylmuramyl-(pentapeptide) pyrophosphoryl-undecaprenol N-acetylglucosamine transferase
MRILIAGGGTGGHVIPALAIAQELRARYNAEVSFVGTARGIETRLVPAAGFPLHLVQVGALKNVSLATRARTLFDLPRAVVRSAQILSTHRIEAVIGVGGYASGPAMLAAALLGRPTLAFEPNVVPGFANRIIATAVDLAAVHFDETCRYFRRCHVTGVPVRREFFGVPPRAAGGSPSLLVFGGSQGAHAINVAILEALEDLRSRVPELEIMHQTGERDYPDAAARYLAAGFPAEVSPFIDDMPGAFARADVLVCRSGASTVAEVAAAGKPAILIPFPRSADDHQLRNAEALARRGAALLLPEAQLTRAALVESAAALLLDSGRRQSMSAAARSLAHPSAARDIASLAAHLAGR